MAQEKFCLRWNDFESNISTAFRELRDDKDFFDVTLACDDEQIQAHKVILSACSPFFRGVLRRNPHAHPLLYLKGVRYTDLQSVLNFMYHGEVNVAQEELNSFLAVAEELRVKGLTQGQSGGSGGSSSKPRPAPAPPAPTRSLAPDPVPPPKKPRPAPPSYHPPPQHHDDDIQEVLPVVKQEPVQASQQVIQQPPPEPYQDHGGQLQQVEDGMGYDEEGYEDYGQYGAEEGGYEGTLVDTDGNKGITKFADFDKYITVNESGLPTCGVCFAFSHSGKSNVRVHVESRHFPNTFTYTCPICAKLLASKQALQNHLRRCK